MQLTIITINRNNAEGLLNTMKSVLCQTSKDFEYILNSLIYTNKSNLIRENLCNLWFE